MIHIFPHLNINKLQGTLIELLVETFISLTGETSQQLHTSARQPDRCCCRKGWVWHKTESCVPKTEQSCYPQQTSQTLDRKPNRLISCHCQPQFNYSWTTSRKNKTNKQQSLKLKVRSIVSDNRAFLIEHCDVSLSSVKRDWAYHVSRCQVDTKNCAYIYAQKKNEKGTLKSSTAGHRQGYMSRTQGSPTWSPLRLRMLDSSISPSAFSEPLTTV